jgi:lipoic acid synthetase
MGLQYVVITSVTRDDLADGGAGVFAETVLQIRKTMPAVRVEVLIPDFQGDAAALETVLKAKPHVLNHNLETVPRLYPTVRPQADYNRSMRLLHRARFFIDAITTKSGIMLGLGEKTEEVRSTLRDLRAVGCGFLTLGQYLQPSKEHLPVREFVHPDVFEKWKDEALEMGFAGVASGPFVRSSYHARDLYERAI